MEEDVVYGKGYMADDDGEPPVLRPLLMDVYRPDGTASTSRPAVVLVHGGGFERGSRKNDQLVALAQGLSNHGYVCFVINYRLMGDHPPAPAPHYDPLAKAVHAAVVDVRAALRHVHANARAHGVDPKRIALLGASAGAIASLGAGLAQGDAFADDGPDYPAPAENYPQVAARAAAIVNLWGSLDFFPELFGPHAPPIMTVHGGKDFTVGLSLLPAENIDALCKKHGVAHYYYPVPEAGHGVWDAVIEGKSLEELIINFLDVHL